ncbi:LamG domain-containing protein [Flavobacterium johnsoniae]|uniref:Concanavalin A-like lectin/glucanases superfamily protein n=1 Tax=Flavobacterium johnsoniae TaxID=986 RepID=A0A1M5IHQ7_FLAJO|nr:LamG domain-containing protein [Flavobacterium johnsoniae]SHG27450.1 Concanavalin A-like lectin/glucanases superfamily protein [Flavobacterium johnsoniae]
MGLKKYIYGRTKVELRKNLVAYYKFDNNLFESTGMSPNGIGSSLVSYVSGKVSGSVYFPGNIEGASIYVDVSNNSNFSFSNGGGNDLPFSISLWVRVEILSGAANFLMTKRDASTNEEWQMAILPDTGLIFNKFSDGTNSANQAIISSNALPNDNVWHHVVYTDDGSKTISGMNFYVDSVLLSKTDSSSGSYLGMKQGNSFIRIGNASWNATYAAQHRGGIDELGIWKNRCLTQKEVSALFNSNSGRTYPF